MTLRHFDAAPEETEKLGVKRYLSAPATLGTSESYFATDGGQMWAIGSEPIQGITRDGNSYPIQGVTLWGTTSANLFYGECSPR